MSAIFSFYLCLLLAIFFFFYGKYFTVRTNRRLGKRYRYRWIYLYGQDEIEGQPSRDYRAYMNGSNLISLLVWALLLVAMVCLFISIS